MRISPSQSSEIRKPKPRVASNHFTCPTHCWPSGTGSGPSEAISSGTSEGVISVLKRCTIAPYHGLLCRKTDLSETIPKLGEIWPVVRFTRIQVDDGARQRKIMSRAYHRRDGALPFSAFRFLR